jgi:hypothetical protein
MITQEAHSLKKLEREEKEQRAQQANAAPVMLSFKQELAALFRVSPELSSSGGTPQAS